MSNNLPSHPEEPNRLETVPTHQHELTPWESAAAESEPQSTPQLQRYLSALHRHRWLILLVTIAGGAAGLVASRFVDPEYEAQSTLWVEVSDKSSMNQGPIRTGELLQAGAWIELLRSYVVLDHVVSEQKLYLETDGSIRWAFNDFALADRFRPGQYRIAVASDGESYTLTSDGAEVERGRVGSPVGENIGFIWAPDHRILSPGRTISFTVRNPRDVSVNLSREVRTSMQKEGNFLRLSLAGKHAGQTTATLNSLAERYVGVAADIKRARLDQLTGVLDEQRQYAEEKLRNAEMELEAFRVNTITLPSDRGTPVAPGLEMTNDPVMSRYFGMQVDREQLRSDREAIERILVAAQDTSLSLDALHMVSAVQASPGLRSALDERTQRRAQVRELLQRYTPEHAEARRAIDNLNQLEEETIPRLAAELRSQLMDRENELESRLGFASGELRQIPPRAIEEARLQRQVAIAENLHATLKQRYEEARLAAVSTIPDIRILDPATVPTRPISDPAFMVIALGFLGSLGLSIAGAIAHDRLDPKVRYPEEITQGMGLPILGVVPNIGNLSDKRGQDAKAHAAEAMREIRMNLVHAHGTAGPVVTTITSPGAGDGKSFISSNLALSFADQGYMTLLIDGDIRRGALHRTLGVERTPGLTDYLSGNATQEEVIQKTSYPNVYIIGAGTRMVNGPELLGTTAMSRLLLEVRNRFGAIIVDSPPLGAGVDAFALGTLTRNLVLVLRTGATDRSFATAKLSSLDRLPIRLLGAVLNGTSASSGIYRYYSYLPEYGVESEESQPRALPVAAG